MTADQERIAALLSEDSSTVALRLIQENPWFCNEAGFDMEEWSRPILETHNLGGASLRLVGSAATGFSMSPEKAGRPFRKTGGLGNPSDIDLALIDEVLFRSCWNEIVHSERQGLRHPDGSVRERVYWGRIDDFVIPERTRPRTVVRALLDGVRRSAEFRGYRASIRLYRRAEDLMYYLVYGIQYLAKRSAR